MRPLTNQKPVFSHPMSAIPGGELCVAEAGDTETQRVTFQTSVAILGYCLPLALIVCLVIGQCVWNTGLSLVLM